MRFSFSPKDILRIVRQRLFWFMIPFTLLAILGMVAISQMPPLYTSRALLQVQEQQVPNSMVQSTVQSEALERLEYVKAQVMARDNLIRIGDQFGVYPEPRMSRTDKDEFMEDRARITVQQQTGKTRSNRDVSVVTTEISFTDEDPRRAQAVANELVSQFESRAIDVRRDQAGNASDFILEEERKVRRALSQLADQIAQIKQDNPTALPDNRRLYESTNQRLLIDRTRALAEISSTETSLQQLEMQKSLYTSSELTPQEQQLQNLRAELSAARNTYQDTYPTIVALKARVLDMERTLDPDAFRENAATEIAALERRLTELRRGSTDHAEVSDRIGELKAQLADLPRGSGAASPGQVSYNGQVFALQSRLNALALQKEDLDKQIEDMEGRIAALPAVESQLYALEEERARLERDLAEVQANRATAERSLSLEAQAKAERINAIERPVAPDEPTSPDKPKLALGVVALAGALAGLFVLIPEILFAKVQSKDHLAEMMPGVPVVEVPRFKTADERLPKLIATASLTAATLVLTVALSWTTYQTLT